MIMLARTDLLGIFMETFEGRVLIPERVASEVCREGKEDAPCIVRLIQTKRIEVRKAKDRVTVETLEKDFSIATGEAEALVLAIEHKGSLVATDDRNAIRACKVLKMEFTTAIAFLLRAFEKKIIDRDEALSRLDQLESVARYKAAIITNARKRLQEE